jgi:hypothetical protein
MFSIGTRKMKYLWLFVVFLFIPGVNAQNMTISDVKVSVTADSVATAREQALVQAHTLAFQKLLQESFPEKAGPLPSYDTIVDMVSDFSIDKEKTTAKSYTASLTFQFEGPKVHTWLQQGEQRTVSQPFLERERKPLKIKASYSSLLQWNQIKQALETSPNVQNLTVKTLSPQNADLEIAYGGDLNPLQEYLRQKGVAVTLNGDSWVISLNTAP